MPQMAVSCCVSCCVSSVSKLLEFVTCHQDVPLLERFARARSAGFGAVEISSNELFEHCPKEAETVGWRRWGRWGLAYHAYPLWDVVIVGNGPTYGWSNLGVLIFFEPSAIHREFSSFRGATSRGILFQPMLADMSK